MKLSIILLIACMFSFPVQAGQKAISGAAKVIDGDTLHVGKIRVRMFGIDAWEKGQRCPDGRGGSFACGMHAKRYLESLIDRRKPVRCKVMDRDRYKRYVALCFQNGSDLGAAMVRAGWGLAYRRYSRRYLVFEGMAKRGKVGGWRGLPSKPKSPYIWRHKQINR